VKSLFKRIFKKKHQEKPKTVAGVLNKYGDNYMRLLAFEKVTKTGLLLGFIVIAMLMSSGQSIAERNKGNHVALIDLKGEINSNRNGTGYSFVKTLNKAISNSRTSAILIQASSPGGSPVQAEMMYRALADYTAKPRDERVPVYVSIQDTCASACLYAISPADKVFAHHNSLVGSIGVRVDSWNFTDLAQRAGITRTTLTSGSNKALLDPFQNATDEQLSKIQEFIVEPLHQQFVTAMEQARAGVLDTEHPDLYTGMVWTGTKAIELGLVDSIASTVEVEELLKEETDATRLERMGRQSFSLRTFLSAAISDGIESAVARHLNNIEIG